MGHKVNPIGLRLDINRTWDSRWLRQGLWRPVARRYPTAALSLQAAGAGRVSRVVIERPAKRCRVAIYTARPGVVIGKKGQDIEKLRQDLSKMVGTEVSLNIFEIRKPEIDAKLVADNIAQQLERRVAFRRAMKRPFNRQCALAHRVSGSIAPVVLAARKLPGLNGTARAVCRCTRCALILIMANPLLRPRTAPAVSRFGSSRVRFWNIIRLPMKSG